MERLALRRFLAPVFAGRSARVEWSRRHEGRDEVIKNLPRLAKARCSRDGEVHIFALVDFHPRHPRWNTVDELRKGILKEVDVPLRPFVHVHVAMHDIEAWILCDRSRLANKLLLDEQRLSRDAEAIDLDSPPKVVLHQLFRQAGRAYRETAEGVDLLANLSIARVYQRCRYFKAFLDDLAGTAGIDLESIVRSEQ